MNLRPIETFEEKYAGVDLTTDVEGAVREGTYSKYLKEHQKISIWSVPFIAMRKVIKNILPSNNVHNLNKKDGEIDSFWLSTDENAILGKV